MHLAEVLRMHLCLFNHLKNLSTTLLQLMGIVVQAGQRFASIADMQVGDGNQQAAVWNDYSSLRTWFKGHVSNPQKIICGNEK